MGFKPRAGSSPVSGTLKGKDLRLAVVLALLYNQLRFPPIFRQQRLFGAFPHRETHVAGIRTKGDAYYCTFRFGGKRYYFTVGNISEAQALAKGAEVDETLGAERTGPAHLPGGRFPGGVRRRRR